MMPKVLSVNKKESHNFSKECCESINLIEGEGVEGDAHRGSLVKHQSRVKVDPSQPNLRQVHLIHFELIEELRVKGFKVDPATMGENITTVDLDLLSLPEGTKLQIGRNSVIEITGLRNPCSQLNNYQAGLTAAVLDRDGNGKLIRKAGVMGIVLQSGIVNAGDTIRVIYPPKPYRSLERV